MSLMSRSRKMAKNNPSGGFSRAAKGALAGGLIGYLYATHSGNKPAASAKRQNLKTRNMRSAAKKKASGIKDPGAGAKNTTSVARKRPAIYSASYPSDAKGGKAVGGAGGIASAKAAPAPKGNPMRTVGKPAKNPKRRRPYDAMKKAAKDKKFNFGKAIRRGFGITA